LLRDCPPDAFVIGGERVYRALLPYCDTAYVTKIFSAFPADAWFPNLDEAPGWSVSAAHPLQHHKGIPFQYVTYRQDR
ncbi:MAG: dihydrofolate reductase, partial [Pseudoflavonifractor sp.]